MLGGNGSNDSDVDPELRMYNNHQEAEKQKRQREKDQLETANKQWQSDLDKRLAAQQALFAQHRRPDAENRVEGMAGKFIHLAELQPESLAAMVLMQYIVFIVSLLVGKKYSEDAAIYRKAQGLGYAYDGSQTIYQLGADGKPSYEHPYEAGEQIPISAILANGYIPEPDMQRSFAMEFMGFLEQQAGPKTVPKEWLEQLYGVNKAAQLQQDQAKMPSSTQEDRMAAGLLNRPQPKPGK
ncbi:hypothetical protein CC99x_005370 [Candidatus Berkiella cookevillensis]|uniref:Uncharacterized protein n=1 Tax=Candidatus Berkiella cookevillensis TaxID=437022 RepID=A0A0Q9YHH9_9GAMM|nr:hypothetical protein [Candidatus Berkiella cookevillensis]MCS5708331.1 hypothetical protein [Candidatus Berkiella cookevillensis]